MSTTAPDYLTTLRDGFAGAVQQWMDQSTAAWDQWSQAWSPVVAAAGLGMPGAPGGARGHQHGVTTTRVTSTRVTTTARGTAARRTVGVTTVVGAAMRATAAY